MEWENFKSATEGSLHARPLEKGGKMLVEKIFELLVSLISEDIIQKMELDASEWCMQGEWEEMDLKWSRRDLAGYEEKD